MRQIIPFRNGHVENGKWTISMNWRCHTFLGLIEWINAFILAPGVKYMHIDQIHIPRTYINIMQTFSTIGEKSISEYAKKSDSEWFYWIYNWASIRPNLYHLSELYGSVFQMWNTYQDVENGLYIRTLIKSNWRVWIF